MRFLLPISGWSSGSPGLVEILLPSFARGLLAGLELCLAVGLALLDVRRDGGGHGRRDDALSLVSLVRPAPLVAHLLAAPLLGHARLRLRLPARRHPCP